MENETEEKDLFKEWDYFLGRINFKDSALDCRAIQFMNEFSKIVNNHIKKEVNKEA